MAANGSLRRVLLPGTSDVRRSSDGSLRPSDAGSSRLSAGGRAQWSLKAQLTVFIIRHGEAEHNVKEKQAKETARKTLLEAGHHPNSHEVVLAQKAAREAVLYAQEADPPLSAAGRESLAVSRERIADLVHAGFLPPSCVLVSPLQRAMQTAALVFPAHENVTVREVLAERRTGLACDSRSRASTLVIRDTFSMFDMSEIVEHDGSAATSKSVGPMRRNSTWPRLIGMASDAEAAASELDTRIGRKQGGGRRPLPQAASTLGLMALHGVDSIGVCDEESQGNSSSAPPSRALENRVMLRGRAAQVLDLLEEHGLNHHAVALVSHKAFLAELERGPLGRPDASECANGEVRVFSVAIYRNGNGSRRVCASRIA